jgi:predicted nucleotidyltransferase
MKLEQWQRYRRQAVHSLESAERDLAEGDFDWASFKAQQAAELAVKGYLLLIAHAVFWNGWMLKLPTDPLNRDERLARVRTYLGELGLRRYRAWVFGSMARGDFTKESDTDVLVISDELPVDRKRRLDRMFDARMVAPEIEPVGWLASELREREATNDPFLEILRREAVLVEEAA